MADATPWIAADGAHETARRYAPATLRNREAIADLLATLMPLSGTVLEVASGSGEHCAYFAERFHDLTWQPSDPEPAARASIDIWCKDLSNTRAAIDLDAQMPAWPIAQAAAVLCINMVHISPWEATLGLLSGAARLLKPGSPLCLYGPYLRAGQLMAPSNLAFDASLKMRDPGWGLRDLEEVVAAASDFALERIVEMPAHNLSIIMRRL